MILWLLMRLFRYKDIARGGSLYLRRFYLTPRTWRWRLFLHQIVRPDADDDPHDHPWPFWTLCVKGWYREVVYECSGGLLTGFRRLLGTCWLRPRFRLATHVHRIVCVAPGGAWTLVLAGAGEREWGFWTAHGWVPWYTYLGVANETAPEDVVRKT